MSPPRHLFVLAWASFISEVLIIATGGAVRLTGSGLGCPTWPTCTPESLVSTPELGIHGAIEFGNRTMTGLVGILALAVLIAVWRHRRERRDLVVLAIIVVAGVAAQAIVGGITVLTELNPAIVGFHYVASVALVCVTAAFLVRLHSRPGSRVVPRGFAVLVHAGAVALVLTLVFGVLTTGSGPHSGDPEVKRTGFDAELLQHVHAWPSYVLAAITIAMLVYALVRGVPVVRWVVTVVVLEVAQIVVGLWQARAGLPELLVGLHMVLAALLAAAYTVLILRLREPESAPSGAEALERQ